MCLSSPGKQILQGSASWSYKTITPLEDPLGWVTPLISHSPECKSNSNLRCFEVSPNVWVTKHGERLSSEIFLGNKNIALWLAINQFFPNRLGDADFLIQLYKLPKAILMGSHARVIQSSLESS